MTAFVTVLCPWLCVTEVVLMRWELIGHDLGCCVVFAFAMKIILSFQFRHEFDLLTFQFNHIQKGILNKLKCLTVSFFNKNILKKIMNCRDQSLAYSLLVYLYLLSGAFAPAQIFLLRLIRDVEPAVIV